MWRRGRLGSNVSAATGDVASWKTWEQCESCYRRCGAVRDLGAMRELLQTIGAVERLESNVRAAAGDVAPWGDLRAI